MANVYLPPKNSVLNDPLTLAHKDIQFQYDMGKMDIINKEEIKKALNPPVNINEYHHTDGEMRHPETLYLIPGNPRHRSDSLMRDPH